MLRFAKDRLYLVEARRGDSLRGRRVLVLSLQGDILQVVTHPTDASAEFTSICCFDDKLLASFMYIRSDSAGNRTRKYGMLALQGL